MTKIAIFVEGQTELIFIREYLLKMYDYQNVWIECYSLFVDSEFIPVEYPFINKTAQNYYQVINVGNDNAVLSRILKREQYMWNIGFEKIFGIRDMYSKGYREKVKDATISDSINLQFIESARNVIQERAKKPQNIYFHFAIMEVEAWILGMSKCFINLHEDLHFEYIYKQLGFNLAIIDPENTFFHPATIVEAIYGLVGKTYSKSKDDINAILSYLVKEDFLALVESGKCLSFCEVHKSINK